MSPILDHVLSGIAGLVLGFLTATWVHAVWKLLHPATIRFWGTWYTDSRVLAMFGCGLAAGWLLFILKSFA